MNANAIEPQEELITVEELKTLLGQFPDDSWIEYKHFNQVRQHEKTIRLSNDPDSNITTITFG